MTVLKPYHSLSKGPNAELKKKNIEKQTTKQWCVPEILWTDLTISHVHGCNALGCTTDKLDTIWYLQDFLKNWNILNILYVIFSHVRLWWGVAKQHPNTANT